uniref:Thioredoxin domain-containing protein n=1 Tax=Globodera pallida TaxID=36090 RepID=A0A183CRD8_GLOPA
MKITYISLRQSITRLVIPAIAVAMLWSCSKTVDEPTAGVNTPSSLDEKAGTWKPYVLASSGEIAVAEPKEAASAEYKAELEKLKQATDAVTPQQREQINYWGTGAVYRWNEIARELCARYNSPPASNAEGKYPLPDAANPLKDPKFPFANPPYAARALAYLSVAQYDALVAAWNYKFKYNRKAPSKNDTSIKTLLPVSDLPSYPSEDAVVAEVSVVILKAMFPGEVPYLEAKLAEHKQSRISAGFFHFTDAYGEALIARKKELFDNVIPASNSMMAHNLYTLGKMLDRDDYLEIADNMLSKMTKLLLADVQWVTNWAALYCQRAVPTAEIAIVGGDADAMRKDFDRFFIPNKIVMGTSTSSTLPLLQNRTDINAKTAIYVCYDKTCQLPVTKVEEALDQLAGV